MLKKYLFLVVAALAAAIALNFPAAAEIGPDDSGVLANITALADGTAKVAISVQCENSVAFTVRLDTAEAIPAEDVNANEVLLGARVNCTDGLATFTGTTTQLDDDTTYTVAAAFVDGDSEARHARQTFDTANVDTQINFGARFFDPAPLTELTPAVTTLPTTTVPAITSTPVPTTTANLEELIQQIAEENAAIISEQQPTTTVSATTTTVTTAAATINLDEALKQIAEENAAAISEQQPATTATSVVTGAPRTTTTPVTTVDVFGDTPAVDFSLLLELLEEADDTETTTTTVKTETAAVAPLVDFSLLLELLEDPGAAEINTTISSSTAELTVARSVVTNQGNASYRYSGICNPDNGRLTISFHDDNGSRIGGHNIECPANGQYRRFLTEASTPTQIVVNQDSGPTISLDLES